MGAELGWGYDYLMVAPEHYRVDYAINPFMDPACPPDPVRAWGQWVGIAAAIRDAGARVRVLGQRADSPDMVYAMNLALVLRTPESGTVAALSHMRYAERQRETESAAAWFAADAADLVRTGRDGIGAHFEAGDAFAWRGDLIVGYGPRTDRSALALLADAFGVRVHGVRTVHPQMYHLDLAFCPLDEERAMICPDALSPESAARLLDLVPEPLVLSKSEALTFCANSIVIGRTVIMPACPRRVRAQLRAWGFKIVVLDVGEFLKGGGAIRCLTNPLDVTLGRDLAPGAGQVFLDHVGGLSSGDSAA